MDPAQDDLAEAPPPRWRALVRPTLARAVASGLALGGAAIPLLLLGFPPIAILIAALIGALGGAPGAALEAGARERGRDPVLTAIACGLALSLAALLLTVQAIYVSGVLLGGLDLGLSRVAELISDARRMPGIAISLSCGVSLGLTLPLAHLVALRLTRPGLRVVGQIFATGTVILMVMFALGVLGIVAVSLIGHRVGDPQATGFAVVAAPVAATVAIAAATLLFLGFGMAALFPPALALADRFGAPRSPSSASAP